MTKDINETVKWWTKAAKNGSEEAMSLLGRGCRDAFLFVNSYMWFSLASAQCRARGGDSKYYVDQKKWLVQRMEPQDVKEAEKLIEEWRRENSK